MLHRKKKSLLSNVFVPSKQRQADNVSDDHNAIHVQELMIRASCI